MLVQESGHLLIELMPFLLHTGQLRLFRRELAAYLHRCRIQCKDLLFRLLIWIQYFLRPPPRLSVLHLLI